MEAGVATSGLVVDTDCGVDGVMALMLALKMKLKEIKAITCCFGNTSVERACENVLRVLHHKAPPELEITVIRGASLPLSGTSPTFENFSIQEVHGLDGFGNCSGRFTTGNRIYYRSTAASALCHLAQSNPGELTIVALAPLTNLAQAHQLDPEFTGHLKGIVCMGGNYTGIGNATEKAEFNFYCDPEAAHLVLNNALCPITLIPWETVLRHGIPWDEFNYLMSPARSVLLNMLTFMGWRYTRHHGDSAYLDCDLLAMIAYLDPEEACLETLEDVAIDVDCSPGPSRGACTIREGGGRVRVVKRMDEEVLLNLRRKMV